MSPECSSPDEGSSEEGHQSFLSCPSTQHHDHRGVGDHLPRSMLHAHHPHEFQDVLERISTPQTLTIDTSRISIPNGESDLTPTDRDLTTSPLAYLPPQLQIEASDSRGRARKGGFGDKCEKVCGDSTGTVSPGSPPAKFSAAQDSLVVIDFELKPQEGFKPMEVWKLKDKEDPLKFSTSWKWSVTQILRGEVLSIMTDWGHEMECLSGLSPSLYLSCASLSLWPQPS